MEAKLIKNTQLGEFIQAEYAGRNESGYRPLNDIVLVRPDGAAEKTAGGIVLTPDMVDKASMAAETGVIVDMGDGAFRWNSNGSRAWTGYRPQPGDRIYMQRYAGILVLGKDQKIYRAMTDTQIAAIESAAEVLELAHRRAAQPAMEGV